VVTTTAAAGASEGTLVTSGAVEPAAKNGSSIGARRRSSSQVVCSSMGGPASGVTVTSTDELTSDGLLRAQTVVSDREGRFVLASVPRIRGWYRLAARQAEAAPAWAIVAGDMTKSDIELRLETCRMHVYGVVSDASGGAVAAAKVLSREGAGARHGLGRARALPALHGATIRETPRRGPGLRAVAPLGLAARCVAPGCDSDPRGEHRRHSRLGPRWSPRALRARQCARLRRERPRRASRRRRPLRDRKRRARQLRDRSAWSRCEIAASVNVSAFASSKANVTVPVDTRARVHGRIRPRAKDRSHETA
jgi:hypothetical protein